MQNELEATPSPRDVAAAAADGWVPPDVAPATATFFFVRSGAAFEDGDALPRLAPSIDPVIEINDTLAACINGAGVHRVDNVHFGPTVLHIRQPHDRERNHVLQLVVEASRPVRYFLLHAEGAVWHMQETDAACFAKHDTRCLLQFHALCSREGVSLIRDAGATLHFVRRQSDFGHGMWASLLIHGAFVDVIEAGTVHVVSVPPLATITFQVVGSSQLPHDAHRYQIFSLPNQPFYFGVSVQPGADEDGDWKVKQISKHKFVYGNEEGEEEGEDAPEDEPREFHHVISALPL